MMRDQRGYLLLVVLLALVVSSMIVLGGAMDAFSRNPARDEATMQVLAQAKDALIGYGLTYRDMHGAEVPGYLPCPDSSDKSGVFHPGDGTAAGSCGRAGEASIGLLPYRSLQLPDLRDAEGNCLWYAVSGTHKNSPKGSDAATPLLMNWDLRGQFRILDASGNPLADPDDAQGGAVAVIIAPAPALAGQVRSAAAYACSADPADYRKYIDVVPAFPNGGATSTFVLGSRSSAANNDRMLWITAREIHERIRQRADFRNPSDGVPPGQINRFLDETRSALESAIQDDLLNRAATPTASLPTALRPPATPVSYASDYRQFPDKLIGEPPAIASLFDASYTSYLVNWRDHLRYAVCSNLASGCLSVGDRSDCRGVLLFGGARAGGGLRTVAERVPASLADPPPPPLTAFLSSYFEAGDGLDVLTSPTMRFAGATQYVGEHPSADVGRCLFPGAFVALKNDAARFAVSTDPTTPAVSVDPVAPAVTLGNPAAPDAAGCVWAPGPLPLHTGVRAYFRFSIATRGEGFVFALVDAHPSLNGHPPGCGASGNALGYGGASSGVLVLNPPKIGLEIDTRSSPARNDPAADHFALVYWGGLASAADDNTHGAGVSGSGSEPVNPRSLTVDSGISTVKKSDGYLPYDGSLPLNTDIHVRLDLVRRHPVADSRGEYQVRVYIASKFGDCQLADFRNLSADLNRLCRQSAKIADTVTIEDIAGLGPAMQGIHAGFTAGQAAASVQKIFIADFLLRSF